MKLKIRKINSNSAVHGIYVWQVRCEADNEMSPFRPGKNGSMVSHYISNFPKARDFLILKAWCTETFGDSVDYQLFYYSSEMLNDPHFNPAWCYQTELKSRKFCIYLNDNAMTLFRLKWVD